MREGARSGACANILHSRAAPLPAPWPLHQRRQACSPFFTNTDRPIIISMPQSARASLDKVKTYLINLDRAPARLAKLDARLRAIGLPYQRIAAVDGKMLQFPHPDFSDLAYRLLHGRRRAPAEVGCYFSHIEALREFLNSDADHALILEDDIAFEPDFRQVMQAAIARAGEWDILRLSTVNTGRAIPYSGLTGRYRLAVALTREKGAGAYMVNRRAAKWLVRQLPMRLAYDIMFDLEYLAGLRAVFVKPLPCAQITGEVTQIQNQGPDFKLPKWRYLTVLPYRAWLEISRLIIRLFQLFRAWGNSFLR